MSSNVYKVIDPEKADESILSPAQMLEIEEDPSKIETFARMLGAVNLDNLFRTMQNPTINPTARIEFQKMLNKMLFLRKKEEKGIRLKMATDST